MDKTKLTKRKWMMGLMLVMLMIAFPQQFFAQERKVQNRPYIDMRRWHYGFLFGIHKQDLEFVNNGYQHTLDTGGEESWFTDIPAYSPGFSVGILGELYLTQHLSLRIIPTMHFGDKRVLFYEQ